MMSSAFFVFSRAEDLPLNWDEACEDNPFLRRTTLSLLETVNPAGQRYYLLPSQDGVSVFVSYQHRLDILTYGFGSLRIPVTIIGIPCSISYPGLRITAQGMEYFRQTLRAIPGGVLILNVQEPPLSLNPTCIQGITLPNCEIKCEGIDFNSYIKQMRSHYRYKILASLKRFQDVETKMLTQNSQFDSKLYGLYEQVYERSDFKLEKLPLSFFQQFPATISVFSTGNKVLGFTQTMFSDQEQIFLFGGLDYALNRQFHTYVNLLLHIIKTGMDQGAERINLGQTAEGVKSRLGCALRPRYLYARHSNRMTNFLIRRGIGLLSYKPPADERHVFK